MKRSKGIMVLVGMLATVAMAGCQSEGKIDAAAFKGVAEPVLARHDAYVQADSSLSVVEKDTYLRSSSIAKALLDAATKPAP